LLAGVMVSALVGCKAPGGTERENGAKQGAMPGLAARAPAAQTAEPGRPETGLPKTGGPAAAGQPASRQANAASAADEVEDPDPVDEAPPSGRASKRGASATQPRGRRRARGTGPAASHEQGAQESAPSFKVSRLVLSRGVSGREPVATAGSFHAAEVDKLYAFVELANEAREPGEIAVAFIAPNGTVARRVTLEVGAEPRWRTWAFTRRPKPAGTWTAVVTSPSGRVLARTSFEITP
jgi:hypothetical protein